MKNGYGERWETIRRVWQKLILHHRKLDNSTTLETARLLCHVAVDDDLPDSCRLIMAIAVEIIREEAR